MDPIRKQQKGTTMETIGKSFRVRIEQGLEFSGLRHAVQDFNGPERCRGFVFKV